MYDARPLPPADQANLWNIRHVALDLLRELAEHDPVIAKKARDRGLDLEILKARPMAEA